jgi:hypothetical protein
MNMPLSSYFDGLGYKNYMNIKEGPHEKTPLTDWEESGGQPLNLFSTPRNWN